MHTYSSSSDIDHLSTSSKTPLLVLDLDVVRKQLNHFRDALPGITPFYSVKTNPHPAVLDTLHESKAHFDVATIGEIKLVLDRGVPASHLLYSHPTKTKTEIQEAFKLGVKAFTLDSLDELKRLNNLAPKCHYFIRIITNQNASLYDYKRKFGASLSETRVMLDYAAEHHIAISGISFMVGSQSMDVSPWSEALESVSKLIEEYYTRLPSLRIVNIGSGFPLPYDFEEDIPSLEIIADAVIAAKAKMPHDITLIAEPGRYIVGPAGVYKTHVERRLKRGERHWLYVDMNAYSGLIEIIESGGKFRYPITSNASGEPQLFTVAGKTLDPDDILRLEVMLGDKTDEGSLLTVHDAGAYSNSFFTSYHTLPLPQIAIVDSRVATTPDDV